MTAFACALISAANAGAEVAVLRQQLATYKRREVKPDMKPQDRIVWVLLATIWSGAAAALVFVTPATLIRWQNLGWRLHWRWRSRSRGRPAIDDEDIALIERISA